MENNYKVESDRGPLWHRWDPHIHATDTALDDQELLRAASEGPLQAWSTGDATEASEAFRSSSVTHNANLVVNANANQVVVSNCGLHRPSQLPQIAYESGGLENLRIRQRVCDILEGGERAFKDQAKRLRVVI